MPRRIIRFMLPVVSSLAPILAGRLRLPAISTASRTRLPFSKTLFLAGLLLAALGLFTRPLSAQPVFINEVVSFNDSGLADEDGNHPDWIEIFNGSSQAINLRGYGLSDDELKPFKWIVPLRVVPVGGFVIVFASGKDRTNSVNLHANFSLRAEGEPLFLTRPDGVRVDQWTGANIPRDYSFGRQPDGSASFAYFARPTPGASNTAPGLNAFAAAPAFSQPGGFLDAAFDLTLAASPEARIHFTLDGSEPTTNSPLYTAPLLIRDRSSDANVLSMIPGTATVNQHTDGWFPLNGLVNKSTVVRARTFQSNAWPSPISTHTYCVWSNAPARYTLPVISIALPTNDLFSYTTGIYVLGKVFSDYTNSHPGEYLTGHTPANYTQRGDAWERRAHFEYFEPGGATGFAQNVLVDIQGQSSRSFREKTLGIKARSDAAPTDAIAYELWPGLKDRAGQPMALFENLRLANSGNDWNETMFRDALTHRLAAPTIVDTLAYRPVVVFLDGEYWGIHNAREQLDPRFFETHYDVPREDVVICETIGSLVDGQPGDTQHYINLRNFIETNDVTTPANYAWINTQMDVQNFIAYQATEIYIANADWPHNNIRFWRKRTAQFETNAPAGHDGRWRWAMFDTDLSYGHSWTGGYGENSLSYALNPTGRPGLNAPWSTLIFRRLMTNPQFRAEYVNTMADLLNSVFKENRAGDTVNQMQAALADSMPEHIRRWRTMGNSMNSWSNNVRVMRTFASQRPINCRQHMVTELGLGGFATMTLNVSHTNRGQLRVNSLVIDANTPGVTNGIAYPWRGTYFRGVPVELEALPLPGYSFAGWSNRTELGLQTKISVSLTNAITYTAMFERATPHDLNAAPFLFTAWSPSADAGSAPAHVRFEQSSVRDPGLDAPLDGDWQLPYNLSSRSRLNGLGDSGLAFLNTGNAQDVTGAGYLGAASVALRTVGVTNIDVSWIGGTVTPNAVVYGIRLQLAVGDGAFQDVPDANGQPIEYRRNPVAGHQQVIGPVTLPATANGQPYVQLRWRYYFLSGTSGARAQLRLDDIRVAKSEPALAGSLMNVSSSVGGEWRFTQFVLEGSPHRDYALQTSTNLSDWEPGLVVTLDINGVWNFGDLRPRLEPARFYRLLSEP